MTDTMTHMLGVCLVVAVERNLLYSVGAHVRFMVASAQPETYGIHRWHLQPFFTCPSADRFGCGSCIILSYLMYVNILQLF